MRLSAKAALSFFLFTGSATAQYFSAGWSPGQKAKPAANSLQSPSTTEPVSAAIPSATASSFLDKLLTSKPAEALFNSLGLNISQRLNEKLWDERVQLITDDNYQDEIVNERLTPQQEKDRVWVIIITAQAAKPDQYSKLIDENFDLAYSQSQVAGDLPHVRWGRIDYLNVTRLTTKWNIWRAPYLVILTDRGKTLRFYHHYQIRLRDDTLRDFLKTKGYLNTAPWSTSFSPGGKWEYILDHFANVLTRIYNIAILFPRWLLVVLSGGIGSFLISLLHRPGKNNNQEKKPDTKPSVVEAEKDIKSPVVQPVVPPSPSPPPKPANDPAPSPKAKLPKSNGSASSSSLSKAAIASTSAKSRSPVATDSERDSATTGLVTKRSSTRQKKNKRA